MNPNKQKKHAPRSLREIEHCVLERYVMRRGLWLKQAIGHRARRTRAFNMSECFICWSGGGVLVEPCRCAISAHAACLASAVVASSGHCRVCLAEFGSDAMCAVLRLCLTRKWAPKLHYLYTWGLIRAGRAAEALLQLGAIDHGALRREPGVVANCSVLQGRAFLQLRRTEEAVKSFQRAVQRVYESAQQLVDVDVLINAKIGLVYAHTNLVQYQQAERHLADATKLCELAAGATIMKALHAAASLAHARGLHTQAFASLLQRHKLALRTSMDVVLHTETLLEAHLARSMCPAKWKLSPSDLCRLVTIIRRTGKKDVVRGASRWLASQIRPVRRLRAKRHPELVEQRDEGAKRRRSNACKADLGASNSRRQDLARQADNGRRGSPSDSLLSSQSLSRAIARAQA